MASVIDENVLPVGCIIGSGIFSIWIISQCVWIIYNKTFQQHAAFKIRGKKMFLLSAFVLILNFCLRPILVSFFLMQFIIRNWFWRLIIDVAQMSLYTIIEFRCWMTYFNLNYNTAIVDKQWLKYLNKRETKTDFFIKYHKYLGNYLYVFIFFSFHGICCVVICGLVQKYYGFNPNRIICHFIIANILLFVIFIHRMYTLFFGIKHTYSHDMLAINKELNMITIIMTATAICDCVLNIWFESKSSRFYVVYQTILIGLLSVIIFYLPRSTIIELLRLENERNDNQCSAEISGISLKHVFNDTDLYYSLIRFMIQEWTAENIFFVSQWMQIQKIIVDSEINVRVNSAYTCHGDAASSALLSIPSDILLLSSNILEAARCIYDKFVNPHFGLLDVDISHQSRANLKQFFIKYKNIGKIFGDNNVNANNSNNMETYHIFIDQIKGNEIDINIIQEMIDSFNEAVTNCWVNTQNSFQRFRYTPIYKKITNYLTFPNADHDDDDEMQIFRSPRPLKSMSYSTPLHPLWE